MTTATVEKQDHALLNAKAHLESIIELWKRVGALHESPHCEEVDRIEEEARESVLSVEVRSNDWQLVGTTEFEPTEGRLLLTTGGPACQIIFDLDQWKQPAGNTVIQFQDWGTPWTSYCHPFLDDEATEALDWFTTLFFYGE